MICFYYRIYGLFIRELIFSYAAQRAFKILRKVFPLATDSFIVNISTNAANILVHRFYRLLYLYFIKSRHIFRDLITYFSRRSDGRSRGNRKSDLPHGGRDDHTGHWD